MLLAVQCLSQIPLKEGMVCGRCERPATIALHDNDSLATSSAIFFLCGEHLKQRLDRHPNLQQHLLQKMGAKSLFALCESS
jgi:hypothetical protein